MKKKPTSPFIKLQRPVVIAVMNRKGGVGKTNTTVNLASELNRRGYKVVIADTEKKGACLQWQAFAGENAKVPVISMYDPMIKVNIAAYRSANDIVLIDTAGIITDAIAGAEEDGKASTINSRVMSLADYVIVPLTPSPVDFQSTEECIVALQNVREFRDGKPMVKILLTATRSNEELTNMAIERIREQYPFKMFDTTIRRTEDFKKAFGCGQGIVEFAPSSLGSKDIRSFTDELLNDLAELV